MTRLKHLTDKLKGPAHIIYHVFIIVLSASIALSLPAAAQFLAGKFLVYWSVIGNEKIFLVSIEIICAVLLIFFFNNLGRTWRDRRLSRMAAEAGLVFVSSARGFFTRKRNRLIKEKQGIGRDIMLIGSTGFRTFAEKGGDLHAVIQGCREARIMLLNPCGAGASIRARSILDPDITLERFREQIGRSIAFLKQLKAVQKNVRLKLYDEVPFLKMAISGDYIWLSHYHAGFDVQGMPEYVFRHNQNPGSLYATFYQYFLKRWNNPGVPEYDLETDELVFRDLSGNEERREKFMAPA
ncbi:MAG: hypothetical protein ACYC69_16345 [Thermodesulfovibrionales bacterium]